MTISGHLCANYMKIFHKTEIQTVILRCLGHLNLNWIKSYNIKLVKFIFFHALKCIISGLFRRSEFWQLLGNQLSYFQNGYFFKLLWSFHEAHKIDNTFVTLVSNKSLFGAFCHRGNFFALLKKHFGFFHRLWLIQDAIQKPT